MTDDRRGPTVLIVTARMGGGHTGAARELSHRLEDAGVRTSTVDLLHTMRLGYGRGIAAIYHAQLRWAPWSYRAIYRSWRSGSGLASLANRVDARMARRDLLESIDRTRPTMVVSDFNLASQVLGELTDQESLGVPFATFITDFGAHPYWLHGRTSAYLTVHESTAGAVRLATDAPVAVCGPLVSPAFGPNPVLRERTRRSLGVAGTSTVALVAAGAWGVGDVEATTDDLEHVDGCNVVVVCGHNRRLAARLRRRVKPSTRVFGFVDTMPDLMNAADVLVGNAGGLTAMEAFRSDLPVVTYRPIPAHGTDNAHAMAQAGVTTFARDRAQLAAAIHVLGCDGPRRRTQLGAARALFPPDETDRILRGLGFDGRGPARVAATRVAGTS